MPRRPLPRTRGGIPAQLNTIHSRLLHELCAVCAPVVWDWAREKYTLGHRPRWQRFEDEQEAIEAFQRNQRPEVHLYRCFGHYVLYWVE